MFYLTVIFDQSIENCIFLREIRFVFVLQTSLHAHKQQQSHYYYYLHTVISTDAGAVIVLTTFQTTLTTATLQVAATAVRVVVAMVM